MKRVAAWVYGLQVLIVAPWFLGSIFRSEQSLWVWQQYEKDLARHGLGDALFGIYLYSLFYSSLVILPYAALGLRYEVPEDRGSRLIVASWPGATYLLLEMPIAAFIHALPDDWNGWLMLFWILGTVLVVGLWLVLERGETRRRHTAKSDGA